MRKYCFLLLLLCATLTSVRGAENNFITISKSTLLDKIKGGWAGQTIGCTYGGPTEFKWRGTMIPDYFALRWPDGNIKRQYETGAGLYDDIYMDLTFVEVIERLGVDAPVDSFAVAFANADYELWHANQAARYNVLNGIMPPSSGHWLNNPHADDLDYQIESDYAGLMSPGMPNTASAISDKIGHIMNYGDGWYGGVFVGAMYALAFVNNDIETVVTEAIKTIPEGSKFRTCIDDVIRWYHKYPNDWKQTWFECQKRWSEDVGCPEGALAPYDIDAVINSAYIVIGLLYGEGDFFRTMDISTRCGQDSDCNPSSAGGILGTMLGYSNIPEYWLKNLHEAEDMKLAYTSTSLNDAYQLSMKHAEEMIRRNGGKVGKNDVTIQVQKPEAVRLEQGFENMIPVRRILVNKFAKPDATFTFDGTGFALTGSINKIQDKTYAAELKVSIDGKEIKTMRLPIDHKLRSQELCWAYQLQNGTHKVKLTWLNPVEGGNLHCNIATVYSDAAAVSAGVVPETTFTIVTGTISDTIMHAVKDLEKYIKTTIPTAEVKTVETTSYPLPVGNIIVLANDNDRNVKTTFGSYDIMSAPTDWNSFAITSSQRKDNNQGIVYFLQAADTWGTQYAIYDLAERLLGVRYLKPDMDLAEPIKDFKPTLINTGVQKPDYTWRGLYPWHYNYNDRGANTFCDINARFKQGDWDWFCKLADWMIKNKQNAVLWFDDVFAHQNISGQMPDFVADYYAKRGIKQVLGMGWASNEDLQGKSDMKRYFCTNEQGKTVEDVGWKRSICPMSDEYFRMADLNFHRMKLNHPENYLGVLIGYGENTWASREHGVDCTKHNGTPSSTMMVRDIKYVQKLFANAGMGNLPIGYVTSTHSIRPGDSPFKSKEFINQLPKNSIFTMHTYQQSEWKQFAKLYDAIAERNEKDSANLKVFHIAEVAFICNADIPLLKPSILRRRSEHFNTLPRENTIGHLATLNTTQYLYWYNTYQELRWQWQRGSENWEQENINTLCGIFGNEKGQVVNEIYNRLTCLEFVKPYAALDSLKQSVPSLMPPPEWTRYNSKTHGDDFGFYLWANVKDIAALQEAKQNITKVIALNESLAEDHLYANEFFKTVLLTAHYYNIRVQIGLSKAYTASGKKSQAKKAEAEAKASIEEYNRLILDLHGIEGKPSKLVISELKRDLALNPIVE